MLSLNTIKYCFFPKAKKFIGYHYFVFAKTTICEADKILVVFFNCMGQGRSFFLRFTFINFLTLICSKKGVCQ